MNSKSGHISFSSLKSPYYSDTNGYVSDEEDTVDVTRDDAEGFKNLTSKSLKNLFSDSDAHLDPPQSSSEIAAWSLAARTLSTSYNKSLIISSDQASTATKQCITTLDNILAPILESDTPITLQDLPSPAAVHAVAFLLAQTAVACDKDTPVSSDAIDCLLRAAEHCTALALDLIGSNEASTKYTLRLALSTAMSLKPLLEHFAGGPQIAMQDVFARMHVLLMASSRLAEAEHTPSPILSPSSSVSCDPLQLWGWALNDSLDINLPIQSKPALSLARVCTESTAVLLGTAWRSQSTEVKGMFVPLTMLPAEKEAVLLLLGRMLSVVDGEESAARIVIPIVTDTLAAKIGDVDAGVYAVAAHVLASMAAVCATNNNEWGYSQIIDLLIKLYKFPEFSISSILMHGTSLARDQQPAIQGRCPGALAHALTHLAENISCASLKYRKDFRRRLLCLFSDFTLLLPNESYTRDLGALLPAIAAEMQHATDLTGIKRLSSSVSSNADLSLDALSSLQEEHRVLHAALRHLWLYSSIFDFASLSIRKKKRSVAVAAPDLAATSTSTGTTKSTLPVSPSWPCEWSYALSEIAAKTPVLLLGSEQLKLEAFHEHVDSEYSSWLAKLGVQAVPNKIYQLIRDILSSNGGDDVSTGSSTNTSQIPASLLAHILTIGYKAICHATFQFKQVPATASPIAPILIHMQYNLPTSMEYQLFKTFLMAAFNAHLKRLTVLSSSSMVHKVTDTHRHSGPCVSKAKFLAANTAAASSSSSSSSFPRRKRNKASSALDISNAAYAALASEETSQVLTDALIPLGPNDDVPATCDILLTRLIDKFPALLFCEKTIGAALQAVGRLEVNPSPKHVMDSDIARLLSGEASIRNNSGPIEDVDAVFEDMEDRFFEEIDIGWMEKEDTSTLRARSKMFYLVKRAAAVAPGPAEAVMIEHLRHLASLGGKYSLIAVKFAPEVMQSVHAGRAMCPLPDVSGSYKGLVAWSMKIQSLGAVVGRESARDGDDEKDQDIVGIIGRSLCDAVRDGAPGKYLVPKMMESAAAVINKNEVTPSTLAVIKLLAWIPLSRFVPEVFNAAAMTWHWLIAACGEGLRELMLEEIASVWNASRHKKIGLFHLNRKSGSSGLSMGNTQNDGPMMATTTTFLVPGKEGEENEDEEQNEDEEEEDDTALLQAFHAHHAWVIFLTEIWRSHRPSSVYNFDAAFQSTYAQMVLSSLIKKDDDLESDVLTLHPAAVGPRFRLLYLSLDYLLSCFGKSRDQLPRGFEDLVGVYRKIVHTALNWFSVDVAWYQNQNNQTSRESAYAVKEFAQLLHKAQSRLQSVPDITSSPSLSELKDAMNAPDTSLLHYLLSVESERLFLWADPIASTNTPTTKQTPTPLEWSGMIATAWSLSPRLALALGSRYAGNPAVRAELQRLVTLRAADPSVHLCSSAVQYLATPSATSANIPELKYLSSWTPMTLQQAICLISTPAARHPIVASYLLRSLNQCNPEELAFFLPQLIQLLRHDPDHSIENFLLDISQRSLYFAYLLVCQLSSEGTPPEEAFHPAVKRSNWIPPTDTGLWRIADSVKERFWSSLHGPVRDHLMAELDFFASVTDISGKLYPIPKEERKTAAVEFLKQITVPRDDLFMPTDHTSTIIDIKAEMVAPMQSAAKCPILVAFDVEKHRTEDLGSVATPGVDAAIFKVGDDCRQDVLALQVISLLKSKFDAAGLPLPLVPYGVVPTGHECGIIQVVSHAKSRAQLGELTDGGLFEVFQYEFGLPGSNRFETARSAFIASCAAYAVASYLLQAKDRHNGNIMLDNRGKIIHIDFGYILGISPGGNMGFESAAFKLSYEMTELLDPGNTRASSHFLKFQELCIKGYLTARSIADDIVATVEMMVPSQLPCFSRGAPIESLRERFHLEMSDRQAAEFMKRLIHDAYDKWTTGVYDLIQYYQNAIPK